MVTVGREGADRTEVARLRTLVPDLIALFHHRLHVDLLRVTTALCPR